jgi:hypothetical protein
MNYLNIFYIIFFILVLNYFINCKSFNKSYNIISNTEQCSSNKNINDISDFINGYWSSDNDFANESEIDEMILNIDTKSMSGFLVIIVDKKIILNDDFDILLQSNTKEIEFVSDNINFIWNDKKFKMHIVKNKGLIQLYHNNTLYASLYKDNKLSALFNK